MNNRELSIPLFVTDVKTSGNKGELAPGQMIIVDLEKTQNGSLIQASNLNKPRHKKSFRIDVGASKRVKSRSSHQGDKTTPIFALEDISELKITYPVSNEFVADEWIIGWNGNPNSNTSFDFQNQDDTLFIVMDLEDGSIPYSGGSTNKERVTFMQPISEIIPHDSCGNAFENCGVIPCKEVVTKLVEAMRKRQIAGGRELQELVEITPIFSCGEEAGTDEVTTWTLSACDLGDLKSLANVQSQVSLPVVRVDRRGSTSIYQTMAPVGVTPSDVTMNVNSIMSECDECPADYVKEDGGYIYTYTVINTTASPSAITFPTQVAGTNLMQGRDGDFVTFTVKTTSILTASQIATLVTSNPTLVVDLVGEVPTVCNNEGYDVEWIEGYTCQRTTRQYIIDLPDTSCGNDRLQELQSAYPEYTVEVAKESSATIYTVTLGGTAGSGNVVINGVEYPVTFATDLDTTASNFVTINGYAIEEIGGSVSASAEVITITIPSSLGFVDYVANGVTGIVADTGTEPMSINCRNQYLITVYTNITCEECSPVFRDFYTAETPRPFMSYEWSPYNASASDSDCKCGIRIRGKRFAINPDSCIEGRINFVEDSVGIKVDAGFTKTMAGYTDLYTAGVDYKAVHKEQVSRKKGRDMLGGNLKSIEGQSEMHFTNQSFSYNPVRKAMLGKESLITDNFAQYAMYSLVLRPAKFTQSFAHKNLSEFQSYDFYVELGKHQAVENELKRLVAAAGAPIGDAQP